MKSIVLADVILIAVCAWGHQAQIVRPQIKYWIESVDFTKDAIEVGTVINETKLGVNREGVKDESQINRTGSATEVEVHVGGEGSVGATATPSGVKPKAEVKITGGGSTSKKWTKDELKELRIRHFVSDTDVKREEANLKSITGNYKLKVTIVIENQTTNVTYKYNQSANSDSGLAVRSSVKRNPLWIPLPLNGEYELVPNGSAKIPIVVEVTDLGHKALLSVWKERGVLKECLSLDLGGQFCLNDKSQNHQDWRPFNMRNAVSINVDIDEACSFEGIFPMIISGRGLNCGEVLDVVSTQLEEGDKFRFDGNGVLYSGLGLTMGTFKNDEGDVSAIMAEVDGELRSCMTTNVMLTTTSYNNKKRELRFIKVGTEEVLSSYQADVKKCPKEVVSNCLSCIESSLDNSVLVSDGDLQNGAELAWRAKNYLMFAHFLSCMSDESRDLYLESPEERQSAIELAIMADNAEYFAKLYSLEWDWGNANRTMLGFAAEKGSTNIVKWLLEKAPEGKRPRQIVDGLVDGAKEDDVDRGKTPLYLAGENGHLDVCRYLVSKGADIDRKFYVPGKKKKEDVWTQESYISDDRIRNFIKAQREVCELEDSWWRSRKPNVSVEDMRRWVEDGVLPNSYLGFHWNLLSWAIELKDVALVKSLIEKGADVNGEYSSTPNEKRTALMLACEVGDTNLVAKLMEKGANLYAHQDNGMSAFNYAIKARRYDCAEMLLDKLDPAKCSLVEDGKMKLNLFEYVGKYCDNKEFCETVKSRYPDAWLNMLVSLCGTGFRECLERCGLSDDEAKKLLEMYPSVQMSDDLYDKGHLRGYLAKMPEGKRQFLQEINPWFIDCFNFLELREKAEQGDAEAQWHLGMSYRRGNGVVQDVAEAAKWYRKAADQGHRYAIEELEELKKVGSQD